MNTLRPSAQPVPEKVVPVETSAGAKLNVAMDVTSFTEHERGLLAKAIQFTRVSYFTKAERGLLSRLIVRVTGYQVKGGI